MAGPPTLLAGLPAVVGRHGLPVIFSSHKKFRINLSETV